MTGKTTHSFRHALADRLRNTGCPEEIVAEILGHSRSGMTKNYGKGFSLEVKQKWLGKIITENKLYSIGGMGGIQNDTKQRSYTLIIVIFFKTWKWV